MENNKTETQKNNPVQQKDVEKFTNELNQKINQISKVTKIRQSKQRKGFFGGINPIIIVLTVLIAFFLISGFLSAPNQSSDAISLTDLITGVNENKFSRIIIQDNGVVKAEEKTFTIVDLGIAETDFNISKNTEDQLAGTERTEKVQEEPSTEDTISGDVVKQAEIADILPLFKEPSIIDSLRNLFSNNSDNISEIIFAPEFTLVVTPAGNENYILGLTKSQFTEALIDEGIDLSEQTFPVSDLFYLAEELSLDSFEKRKENGEYEYYINFGNLLIAKRESSQVKTYKLDWTPNIFSFTDFLATTGIDLNNSDLTLIAETKSISPSIITLDTIMGLLTIAGFVFVGFVIFRSAQSSGMGIMQFGQSRAKMFFGKKTDVSFKDVAGIDEAREELNEIVEFLKRPQKFLRLGARIPKGILMFGPPGTGKTLLARAIAGEAGVPFFHTSGSEFEEMLVGAGASRVRDLFAKAKKAAPSLIFIDEIDAVARKRGTRIQSGSTEQTLNQILVEMDGFEKNTNVIVIAATNRPDVLDPAILRPGRFDRQVAIDLPDKDGRMNILKIHAKNKPLAKEVDLERIARRTVGSSGADLENILNEAAIIAAKQNQKEIRNDDIYEAISKVYLGPAKKSRKRTEEELKLVAYHEAGHAVVAKYTPKANPVDKVSIISRGRTGGVTMFLPEKDENIVSKAKLIADITVSLGGRAAEELVLDDISTGASNDIQNATKTAREMIQKYGMTSELGLVQYGSGESRGLGYAYGDSREYSEKTAELIDEKVRQIVAECYENAKKILSTHRDKLDKVASLLLEKEVLDRDEFYMIFDDVENQ
ncbi:MAG: hypothetical protein Kow0081_4200 [Candidatus Dojkabacteria bacterium]